MERNFTIVAAALVAAMTALAIMRGRSHLLIWVPRYLLGAPARRARRQRARAAATRHLIFCLADHFEPGWGQPGLAVERQRVDAWLEHYPALASQFCDASGRHPQHTFFYPCEEYRPEHLDKLARMVADGWGEVEIHLHHDRDTAVGLAQTLEDFKRKLRSHGLLGSACCPLPGESSEAIRFGFIHGNWALDNSRPDGRWCGVNDELGVLRRLGCYADFTLPSAPSPTQTRKTNSIYWATDDPQRPKSHDIGRDAVVGEAPVGDLLIIQGPLALDWRARKWGLLPAVENGEVTAARLPSPRRVRLWAGLGIGIVGRPEWTFVKVYTHGCEERNTEVLFGEPALLMHQTLQREYNDGRRWRLHYVTAREMYNIIIAACAGHSGDPDEYRDFAVLPPPVARRRANAYGSAVSLTREIH